MENLVSENTFFNKDIVLNIFTYIPHVEKFIILKRVCKKWNDFLKDKWFWRSVMISEFPDLKILPSNFDSEKWFWYKFIPIHFQSLSKIEGIKKDAEFKVYLTQKKSNIQNLHKLINRNRASTYYNLAKEDLEKEAKKIDLKNNCFENKVYKCLQQGIILHSVLRHQSKNEYRNVIDYYKIKFMIPTLDGKLLVGYTEEYAREKIDPITKAYLKLIIQKENEEEFLFYKYNSGSKFKSNFKSCQTFINKYICPNQKIKSVFDYQEMYQLFGMNYKFVEYCCC